MSYTFMQLKIRTKYRTAEDAIAAGWNKCHICQLWDHSYNFGLKTICDNCILADKNRDENGEIVFDYPDNDPDIQQSDNPEKRPDVNTAIRQDKLPTYLL